LFVSAPDPGKWFTYTNTDRPIHPRSDVLSAKHTMFIDGSTAVVNCSEKATNNRAGDKFPK